MWGLADKLVPNSLKVANRELGTVDETKATGQIKVHSDSGRVLNFNIEDHRHLDYGYAVTSHSGQGQTTDRVLINVDTELGKKLVNERLAYVAVSRARYDAQIYTNDQAELAHDLSREYSHSTATNGHSHENEHEVTHSSEDEHEITQMGDSTAVEHDMGSDQGLGQGPSGGHAEGIGE